MAGGRVSTSPHLFSSQCACCHLFKRAWNCCHAAARSCSSDISAPASRFSLPQASGSSWGAAKPRNGLRPRDANVPVVSAQAPAAEKKAGGRSMSQLLASRSEAASGKKQRSGPAPLPDIDSADTHDPLAATDWVQDIFAYYKRVEPSTRVASDYMSRQVGKGRTPDGGEVWRHALPPLTQPPCPATHCDPSPSSPRPLLVRVISTTRCAPS